MLQIFKKGIDRDMAVLMAARAARLENQDAIDTAIVSMLSDPKEVSIKDSTFTILYSILTCTKAVIMYCSDTLSSSGTCWNQRTPFPSIQSS